MSLESATPPVDGRGRSGKTDWSGLTSDKLAKSYHNRTPITRSGDLARSAAPYGPRTLPFKPVNAHATRVGNTRQGCKSGRCWRATRDLGPVLSSALARIGEGGAHHPMRVTGGTCGADADADTSISERYGESAAFGLRPRE